MKIRPLAVLLLTGALVGTSGGTALAHYVYESGQVASYGDRCVDARSEVSHGSHGNGYTKADVESYRAPWNSACAYPYHRPVNYLKVKNQLFKQLSNGSWGVCYTGNTVYNSESSYNWWTSLNFSSLPCGYGKYQNLGRSYVLNNGTWYGGLLWSGPHYLPA